MRINLLSITALMAAPVAAYIMPGSPEWDALEAEGGAFETLMDSLSSPDILKKTDPSALERECTDPFAREGYPSLEMSRMGVANGSNYELFDQPSGLCADHLSCAFAHCQWPFEEDNSTPDYESDEALDLLNLPAYVLHPESPQDIVAVTKFAAQHDIGISVKVSGHSYLGGSTSKGSILVHMRSYPKHAQDDSENALVDCREEDESNVCRLAQARGVPAALRVGGGEVWDEVYRALHAHNAQNSTQKYHIVGAAAGTVSAAGGWLSGGGLSGTTGMRLYGFGADQILQMEMVLANGWHVRFGPSEWEQVGDSSIPKTTAVAGECYLDGEWKPCPSDSNIDFMDLWYAVRGGAAGYGVVTSTVYQLHDKPGQLHTLWNNGVPPEVRSTMSEEAQKAVTELWMNFLIDFFFDPASLGVSEKESNSCGSPALAVSMDIFNAGSVYCHNSAGPVMLEAWTNTVVQANSTLQEAGVAPDVLPILIAVFSIIAEVEDVVENSYFFSVVSPNLAAGVPPGKLFDFPKPGVVPTYHDNYWTAILPKSWVLDKERSIPFLYDYIRANPLYAKMFYVLGGRSALDHDHHNAVSSSQRDASFVISTLGDKELTERFRKELYGGLEDTSDFPAGAEYNHVGNNEMGPLKEDWAKPCPMEWSRQEKVAQCVSLQESVWGTTNLAKLTGIKNSVDPNNTFNCFGCVGYVDVHATMDNEPLANDERLEEEEGESSAGFCQSSGFSLLLGAIFLFASILLS